MKKAVITGASGAIGGAAAEAFRDAGYIVYAAFNRNMPKISGVNLVRMDVTSDESVLAAAEKIGGADVLINNSGIAGQKMFCDITGQDWDRMFDVNIKGIFRTTKAFLPYMISKKNGKVINVASIWGEVGASCEVHYSASKAAVIGFTKALAKEVSLSGVTVNCVSPGMIESPMNSHLAKEDIEELEKEIPLGRCGTPKEAAQAMLFLASDMADYITGQVISVSGGWNIV